MIWNNLIYQQFLPKNERFSSLLIRNLLKLPRPVNQLKVLRRLAELLAPLVLQLFLDAVVGLVQGAVFRHRFLLGAHHATVRLQQLLRLLVQRGQLGGVGRDVRIFQLLVEDVCWEIGCPIESDIVKL